MTLYQLSLWENFLDQLNSDSLVSEKILSKVLSQEQIDYILSNKNKNSETVSYIKMKTPLSLRYSNDAWFWSNIIKLEKDAKIITELCPGSSIVIDLALAYAEYSNLFYKVDFNIEQISPVPIKNSYELKKLSMDVIKQVDEIPQSDIIILNHAIDDLFMGLWAAKTNFDFFSLATFTNTQLVTTCWADAMKERDSIYPVLQKFMLKLLNRVNLGGLLIIRDYPSSYETWKKEIERITFTRNLTESLVAEILNSGFKRENIVFDSFEKVENTFFVLRKEKLHATSL